MLSPARFRLDRVAGSVIDATHPDTGVEKVIAPACCQPGLARECLSPLGGLLGKLCPQPTSAVVAPS